MAGARIIPLLVAIISAACSKPNSDGADAGVAKSAAEAVRALVFSRTLGFRHDSIPTAVAALTELAKARGWSLESTEDPSVFNAERLRQYNVVVFLLTSGDVLNDAQQSAFEHFINAGNGFVGIHSASDTEYDWPWYGALVGAYFKAHPPLQQAKLRVERMSHLSTHGLPEAWTRTDEWYSFRTNPRANVNVLLSVDESSYSSAESHMNGDHPIAWYHGYAGGRAFYTALGHTRESYQDPLFLEHVAGAVEWAAGREWQRVVLVEFDGVSPNGTWSAHGEPGKFQFEVLPERFVMRDGGGQNQHVVRRGIAVDPARRYVVETLFSIHADAGAPPNSFCLNLGVAGGDADLSPPSSWAMNLDVEREFDGVMKFMGFVRGAFRQIGEQRVGWARLGHEYLMRVEVDAGLANATPKQLSVAVFENGSERQKFQADYSSFPFQPEPGKPLRVGMNAHGASFTLRSLRVYYPD